MIAFIPEPDLLRQMKTLAMKIGRIVSIVPDGRTTSRGVVKQMEREGIA
ncbi:hypothetical protein AA105894_2857 [Asaia spathodeae NBRC 105894]|nr:hypothetical protein AA105894_2857 [Asaia spathodeae NBRC 105894]